MRKTGRCENNGLVFLQVVTLGEWLFSVAVSSVRTTKRIEMKPNEEYDLQNAKPTEGTVSDAVLDADGGYVEIKRGLQDDNRGGERRKVGLQWNKSTRRDERGRLQQAESGR
jgi:hypothetical protein